MFRPTFAVFALLAVASAQRSFINKCSLSDPELEECFVRNGNIAIEELYYGYEDLQLPSLDGYDLGDLIFNLDDEDLSFTLEDGKSYPQGIRLENANIRFGPNNQLRGLKLRFAASDITWQAKYRASGSVGSRKIKESGMAQINFGESFANFTLEFKRKEVDGIGYLKVRNHRGIFEYEKFEFLPRNVQAMGEPLELEQFNKMEPYVIDKFLEICLEVVTFSFNQIFQEMPEDQIFLP